MTLNDKEKRKIETTEMMYNQTVNSAPSLRAEGEEPLVPNPKEHVYDIRISARTKTQKFLVYTVLIFMAAQLILSVVFLCAEIFKRFFA